MRGRLRSTSGVNDAGGLKAMDDAGSGAFAGGSDEIPAYGGKHDLRLSHMLALIVFIWYSY